MIQSTYNEFFISPIRDLGAMALFARDVWRVFLKKGVQYSQVIDQIYVVGVRSLSTTVVAGVFVGAIMALQIHLQLQGFGAGSYLGGLSTSVTIRNVGPVVIAFMLSGKVGAYTSAELGTMRVTEQMDAVRCLGANPIQYIILPRMIAVIISSFLLLIIGLMVGIMGGVLLSSWHLGMNADQFILYIPEIVTGWSVATGVCKSFVLGSLIGLICCYHGYYTTGGAVGVGRSVKRTAVQSLVAIIVADFSMTTLSNWIYELFALGRI